MGKLMEMLAGILAAARRPNSRPFFLIVLLVIVLPIIVLPIGCRSTTLPAPTPTVTGDLAAATRAASADASRIRALGTLRPAQKLSLSFPVSGQLSTLDLQIGQQVKAGALLASIDVTNIERAIQNALEEVEIQQAELAMLHSSAESVEAQQAVKDNAYQIARAEIALDVAQLNLEHGRLNQPASGLTRAQSAQEAARIKILESEVAAAQLALTKLQAWQNPYIVDQPHKTQQTTARLRQAELEVERLQAQLVNATMVAPFDGTISAINIQIGEWADAGRAVLEIIDTSYWLVETKNIGEQKIGRISVGQGAAVTITVFPEQPIEGEVISIAPMATVQQGDTTYTLHIRLAQTGLPLRVGMNTQVAIITE